MVMEANIAPAGHIIVFVLELIIFNIFKLSQDITTDGISWCRNSFHHKLTPSERFAPQEPNKWKVLQTSNID